MLVSGIEGMCLCEWQVAYTQGWWIEAVCMAGPMATEPALPSFCLDTDAAAAGTSWA